MKEKYSYRDIDCKHCQGSGKIMGTWEEYVYHNLPDRMQEALEQLNAKLPIGSPRFDWRDIASRSNLSPFDIERIFAFEHRLTLGQLYSLADALEVNINDLLPIP